MSIVKSNTLSYFYDKLKQVFARSVNGKKPDLETGDISITNVETANNLVGGDAVESFSRFSFRTAGGAVNITSGEANLAYIEGNTIRVDSVDENWEIESTNDLNAAVTNASAWRSQISTSVEDYTFTFINSPPNSALSSPYWTPSESDNMWAHNGNALNILSYGITTNATMPSLTAVIASTSINTITLNPYVFTQQISTGGTHEFVCIDDDNSITWFYNSEEVSLNTYGINISSGTAASGNKITITYIVGTPNNTSIIINYTAPELGTLINAKPVQFIATGYNQFNLNDSSQIIENATINSSGVIISNTGTYVCFCKASSTPYLGYVAYTPTGTIITAGQCSTIPTLNTQVDIELKSDVDLEEENLQSRTIETDGYFVVAVNTITDLCIHTRWDNEEDTTTGAYVAPSTITLPLYATDGTTPLNIITNGMSSVGSVADKFIFGSDTDPSGSYIKKIGIVENNSSNMADIIAYNTEYIYDDNTIYYVLKPEDQVVYQISCSGVYTVNDFGTEEFIYADDADEVPLQVEAIYGENLRNKLKGDVVTISTPLELSQSITVLKNLGFQFNSNNTLITDGPVKFEFYKIGDMFITTRNGNPSTLLGYGTWQHIDAKFLLSASNSNNTGTYVIGGQDLGETTVTLTSTQMPSHTHTLAIKKNVGSGTGNTAVNYVAGAAGYYTSSAAGGGQPHNNMPPYFIVHIWKRTA